MTSSSRSPIREVDLCSIAVPALAGSEEEGDPKKMNERRTVDAAPMPSATMIGIVILGLVKERYFMDI